MNTLTNSGMKNRDMRHYKAPEDADNSIDLHSILLILALLALIAIVVTNHNERARISQEITARDLQIYELQNTLHQHYQPTEPVTGG